MQRSPAQEVFSPAAVKIMQMVAWQFITASHHNKFAKQAERWCPRWEKAVHRSPRQANTAEGSDCNKSIAAHRNGIIEAHSASVKEAKVALLGGKLGKRACKVELGVGSDDAHGGLASAFRRSRFHFESHLRKDLVWDRNSMHGSHG
jgi:hypothetical protein